MIQVAIITTEQFNLIDGFQIEEYRIFKPIKDANDNYFLALNDIEFLTPYFDFISNLSLSEYLPKPQTQLF
ncbi:hypothetical protein UFOVP200_30 [uncultured Caudovirales phage]|uniref:Uncharacterized protein n=1 Tax=uncultured Caudovirales phage TaxID=2100421 RepID=A0A6J7WIL2_9CAUD|nr:hypothetical protein UFOVP200_30 [uncultured Caudovirales phage]